MAEDGRRVNGFSPGLALILSSEDRSGNSQRTHLVSCHDDIGNQSVERSLEYIFDLPHKSVHSSMRQVDADSIHSIIRDQIPKHKVEPDSGNGCRDGVIGPVTVTIDETSICGDLRVLRQPLVVESFAMFSSARANNCVWKGKWMYEVVLETSGIQQLGWATLTCPFTDRKGVGDAEDSYAYDGRRVSKWNKDAKAYGQSWVAGDVIACCIDLEACEISFYRNGVSLGVAFDGVRRIGNGLGYFPAISLSEGESCDLNFGDRPFKYPVEGFLPLQAPPSSKSFAVYLLRSLSRLLEVQCLDKSESISFRKLTRLKRFLPHELFYLISREICLEFLSVIEENGDEYVAWGPLLSFLLEVFGTQAPHDYASLDLVVDLFLEFPKSGLVFQHVIKALSSNCKTAQLVLVDCPFSGSYPYIALACHILKREELMVLWWMSVDFESTLEDFLSRKGPNKQDLQCLIPSVWWPGSCEDMFSESKMTLTTAALSEAVNKSEEMHRELCRLVIQFIPPVMPRQSRGSVFRKFLQNLIMKIRGVEHKLPASGGLSNSVIVSLYTVILHFLSEGVDICGSIKGLGPNSGGFLHRAGQRSFPTGLFFKMDPYRTGIPRLGGSFNHLLKSHPVKDEVTEEICWDEGCVDDEDTKVTHSTRQKPCCCSSSDIDIARMSKDPIRYTAKSSRVSCGRISDRSAHVAAECGHGSLNDEIVDKPSSSVQSESDFVYRSLQHLESVPKSTHISSALLREEELLDVMLLFYHLGVAQNFKQASYYISHQSQSISLLDETDKHIREKSCSEQLKRLKEARNVYREELLDCVRQCIWYRVSLFSWWKLRGMYATCMWIVQLLLVLSKNDLLFIYIPEFYLEALVDCFHGLRRSDPPFVSSAIFMEQGLSSFVTFLVAHFNDPRILSADIKDLLLQSISVLVQYRDYLGAFESNKEAVLRMPRQLLLAFDNRSWILVTNILLRLCKGSGFGFSKQGESSSSSVLFQGLLRDACIHDEQLSSSFLNRLFNTLSWTITEFSVSIREMQENYQIAELQQRKCSVVYELSCSLARVLEFCTHEIPHAFLLGPSMNLQRLTELIVFILNHIISAVDSEFFDLSLRRHSQFPEKTNQAMILAPIVGIILNLMDITANSVEGKRNDIVEVFASMDCPATICCGFQYLLEYNWGTVFREDASLAKLLQLEQFSSLLRIRTETGNRAVVSDLEVEEEVESCCCICYSSYSDAQFEPCHHKSCFGCISRHLLNSQRCFFCNATVVEVVTVDG